MFFRQQYLESSSQWHYLSATKYFYLVQHKIREKDPGNPPRIPQLRSRMTRSPVSSKRDLDVLHTMLPRRLVRRVSAYHIILININPSHKSCCRREAAPNLMFLCLPRTYSLCLSFLECCVFQFYSFRLDCNFCGPSYVFLFSKTWIPNLDFSLDACRVPRVKIE